MSEKDKVFSSKVQDKKAIFDLGSVYDFCFTWLNDENYIVMEDKYSEKIKPNGKELEIIWTAKKKVSDYFRFILKIRWFIIGLKDVEVEKNGNKVKMNKGDFEITVKGVLERDYEHSWEQNQFYKSLRKMYNRFIVRGRIDQYEEKLYGEADDFLAEVKAFLALEAKS